MRALAPTVLIALLAAAAPAAAVQVNGVDPHKEPIPGASFGCYAETAGDAYATPGFTLRVGPGRTYSTPAGSGAFTVDPSEILSVTFTTGPFAPDAIPSAVRLDDWGQVLSLNVPDGTEYECYQSGPRQAVALADFRLKEPAVGTYRCSQEGTDAAPESLQILPGKAYRYEGGTGTYRADVLRDPSRSFSGVDFTGGPLDGEFATYRQDPDSGLRVMSINLARDVTCASLGAPTVRARFGPGRAPKPPRGAGGLQGLYAAYQVDVTGVCGGLCWSFLTFTRDGRVYTREPRTGPADAACTRRLPNTLPVCETYTRRGDRIRIGQETTSFARSGATLRIGNLVYRPVKPAPGQRLRGAYRSTTTIPNPDGTGGVTASTTFTFTPSGGFTRTGFAGATFSPLPGNPGAAVTTLASSGNRGTYRAVGPNTLEFRFPGGARTRVFFFVAQGGGQRPQLLRLSGSTYLPR